MFDTSVPKMYPSLTRSSAASHIALQLSRVANHTLQVFGLHPRVAPRNSLQLRPVDPQTNIEKHQQLNASLCNYGPKEKRNDERVSLVALLTNNTRLRKAKAFLAFHHPTRDVSCNNLRSNHPLSYPPQPLGSERCCWP